LETKHIAPWPQLHSTLFVYVWANQAHVAVCVSPTQKQQAVKIMVELML